MLRRIIFISLIIIVISSVYFIYSPFLDELDSTLLVGNDIEVHVLEDSVTIDSISDVLFGSSRMLEYKDISLDEIDLSLLHEKCWIDYKTNGFIRHSIRVYYTDSTKLDDQSIEINTLDQYDDKHFLSVYEVDFLFRKNRRVLKLNDNFYESLISLIEHRTN
ncbi:hypothetical protein EZV73_15110 [Acidaminobacter sp. JC074]|uniref:hypothetical protein n=1 Tax=Acidaminobacter sp. JC074 TaxID=2530199 RepID=UPI001F100063|nr:hypothetical protein [Acidaminobacter sp. JC074]MCH4888923.1 hypothetical protein [Acidaminobacter sp. JC074]